MVAGRIFSCVSFQKSPTVSSDKLVSDPFCMSLLPMVPVSGGGRVPARSPSHLSQVVKATLFLIEFPGASVKAKVWVLALFVL